MNNIVYIILGFLFSLVTGSYIYSWKSIDSLRKEIVKENNGVEETIIRIDTKVNKIQEQISEIAGKLDLYFSKH